MWRKIFSVSFVLKALAVWGTVFHLAVLLVTLAAASSTPPEEMQDYANGRAIFLMAGGLIVLWIILGGFLMVRSRDRIRAWVLAIPLGWQLKFVLFCTLMACLEEAITTTMTNLAPLLGGEVGKAFITASTNYFQVICFNSVIVFIPMFVAWAGILDFYNLKPSTVLLLFGLTGTLVETQYGGSQNLFAVGMWVYVYGLMIYLPVYCLPERPKARPVTSFHGLLAFAMAMVLPFLCAIPIVRVVMWVKALGIQFGPQFVP